MTIGKLQIYKKRSYRNASMCGNLANPGSKHKTLFPFYKTCMPFYQDETLSRVHCYCHHLLHMWTDTSEVLYKISEHMWYIYILRKGNILAYLHSYTECERCQRGRDCSIIFSPRFCSGITLILNKEDRYFRCVWIQIKLYETKLSKACWIEADKNQEKWKYILETHHAMLTCSHKNYPWGPFYTKQLCSHVNIWCEISPKLSSTYSWIANCFLSSELYFGWFDWFLIELYFIISKANQQSKNGIHWMIWCLWKIWMVSAKLKIGLKFSVLIPCSVPKYPLFINCDLQGNEQKLHISFTSLQHNDFIL